MNEIANRRKSIPPAEYLDLINWLEKEGYDFIRFIKNGGGGAVFEVYWKSENRVIALKALNQKYLNQNPEFADEVAARFKREIETVEKLKMVANVATYYECSLNSKHPYFTMELIDGPDLSQIMRNKERLSVADASQTHVGDRALHSPGDHRGCGFA